MTRRRLDQPEPDWPFKFVGRAAGGFLNEKALRAKVLRRVSENLSGMLYQLFSSFLRGASCPKSPRAPPLPATLFMRLTDKDVKAEKFSWRSVSDCATSPEVARFPDTMRHAHTERSA